MDFAKLRSSRSVKELQQRSYRQQIEWNSFSFSRLTAGAEYHHDCFPDVCCCLFPLKCQVSWYCYLLMGFIDVQGNYLFLLLVQPPKMINYIVDEHYIDVESPLLNRVKMTEGIQGECCSITTSRWFTD
nr:uncharacterized protein LOC107421337 [Ziziphus jujuba var. spinosa]XP_024927941.2 uncharacterized protein LOC107421337 [Ziziphus jujuba var. spinosa]